MQNINSLSGLTTRGIVLALLSLPLLSYCADLKEDPNYVERLKQIKDGISKIPPATIYGKVVDQNGALVANAEVKVGWEEAMIPPDSGHVRWVAADQSGMWQITVEKPVFISVHNARKPGYEFIYVGGLGFRWEFPVKNGAKGTTKENPVVITMRKKGDTSFLVGKQGVEFRFHVNESGKTKGYDFIQQYPVQDLAKLMLNGEPLVCDLQVQAKFNPTTSDWTVVMKPGNTNGGIFAADKLLYGAPDTGYLPECVFVPERDATPTLKYLYLRSRVPEIFTLVEIDCIYGNKDFIRIGAKAITNPYGDRNLEGETDIPYEVAKKLTDEAKAAHRQGERPEKPDLPKMIKEAKDKVGKDKPNP